MPIQTVHEACQSPPDGTGRWIHKKIRLLPGVFTPEAAGFLYFCYLVRTVR